MIIGRVEREEEGGFDPTMSWFLSPPSSPLSLYASGLAYEYGEFTIDRSPSPPPLSPLWNFSDDDPIPKNQHCFGGPRNVIPAKAPHIDESIIRRQLSTTTTTMSLPQPSSPLSLYGSGLGYEYGEFDRLPSPTPLSPLWNLFDDDPIPKNQLCFGGPRNAIPAKAPHIQKSIYRLRYLRLQTCTGLPSKYEYGEFEFTINRLPSTPHIHLSIYHLHVQNCTILPSSPLSLYGSGLAYEYGEFTTNRSPSPPPLSLLWNFSDGDPIPKNQHCFGGPRNAIPAKAPHIHLSKLDSEEQKSMGGGDAIKGWNGTCEAEGLTPITFAENKKKRTRCISSSKSAITGSSISLEDIQQHSSMTREKAAESLGVSISTFKRAIRKHGISNWSHLKRRKKSAESPSELKKMDVTKQDIVTSGSRKTDLCDVNPVQEVQFVTIKAKYVDEIIKFQLASLSKIEKLMEEVAKRLKLEVGSFSIKYVDEANDQILLACSEDLQLCIDTWTSFGKTDIKMLVKLTTTI